MTKGRILLTARESVPAQEWYRQSGRLGHVRMLLPRQHLKKNLHRIGHWWTRETLASHWPVARVDIDVDRVRGE